MKRAILTVCLFAVLVMGAYFAYAKWLRKEALPEGLIQANGRIEGDHITISSKFAGRIAKLHAYEGDEVHTGDVLVCLDDKQTTARVAQAKQAVAACDARIQAAEAKIEAAKANVKAAQTSLAVLKQEVPLAIASAEADLTHAQAAAASADSSESKARRDVERNRKMIGTGAITQEQLEGYELVWTVARNELTTASAAVKKAQKQLAEAELGSERIQSKQDELVALQADLRQAGAARQECVAARAEAEAALAEAESVLQDLTILAPSPGMITTRMADVGEVVLAGTPLFDIVDLDRLYLKVYIPEVDIGKVRLGLRARIHTDAFPEQPVEATVRYISSRAEFTPKEVQTPDERVKLVYAVKLYLDVNPHHSLTPGLPADAVIRWKDGVAWAKPQW